MNRHGIKTMAAILAVAGLVPAIGWGNDGVQGHNGRGGPPPEVVEACKSKSEGDSVEFTTPRGDKIKATCRQINGQLVAVPEGGFPKPPNGPPQ